MSKDLTRSAKSFHDQVNANQIGYKSDSIGESIIPQLVKRARLNPTVVDGAVEKRIYYSLHNDASQAVYVSPYIRLENSIGETQTEVLNKPEENIQIDVLNPPDDPYAVIDPENPNPLPGPNYPPNDVIRPPFIPVKPEIEIPDDDDPPSPPKPYEPTPDIPSAVRPKPQYPGIINPGGESDNESNNGTGGFDFIPGPGNNNDDDEDDDDEDTPTPTTNFDDYTEKLVNNEFGFKHYPRNIKSAKDVTRFYESTHNAETANRAFKLAGISTATFSIPKLEEAEEMFASSSLKSANCTFKSLTKGKKMFEGCGMLDSVKLDAPKLNEVEGIFNNCSVLRLVSLNGKPSDCTGMFAGNIILESVEMDANSLNIMDSMFKGCNNLQIGGLKFKSKSIPATSAVSAFEKTSFKTFTTYKLPNVINVSRMLANCNRLTDVSLTLPNATTLNEMLAIDQAWDHDSGSSSKAVSDGVLKSITLDAPNATSADGLLQHQYNLQEVDIKLGKQDGSGEGNLSVDNYLQNCDKLKSITFLAPSAKSATDFLKGTNDITNINLELGAEDVSTVFVGKDKLTNLRAGLYYAINLKDVFKDCINLEECTLTAQRVEGSLSHIFPTTCTKLRKIDNTLNGLNKTADLYSDLTGLEEVQGEWKGTTNAAFMFYNCNNLKVVKGTLGSARLTDILPSDNSGYHGIFQNCKNLKEISELQMAPAANCRYAFYNSGIDTVKKDLVEGAELAEGMYAESKVTTAYLNMPKATSIPLMYHGCRITDIEGTIDLSNVTDARYCLRDSALPKNKVWDFCKAVSEIKAECTNFGNNTTGGPTVGCADYISVEDVQNNLAKVTKVEQIGSGIIATFENGWNIRIVHN